MLGKVWKKVLFFVLIIACVFNVMIKLIKRTSLKSEIESTVKYVKENKIIENVISNDEKILDDSMAAETASQGISKPTMVIETK